MMFGLECDMELMIYDEVPGQCIAKGLCAYCDQLRLL